ncbi:MAG: methylmalonyl-CoA epimerase [Anaerolineales bacterium]|nr:methylmalonyl-CoA epimerase [Anaerolineales bacterium]
MTVKRIDHVAILIDDMEGALRFWRDALGITLSHTTDVPAEMAQVAFLPVGESEIELVKPTTSDSGLARFLEKRGPGMHHVCLEVDDIAATIASLKEKGVQMINEEARLDADGRKYAFIHPKSALGVMVELYELPSKVTQAQQK